MKSIFGIPKKLIGWEATLLYSVQNIPNIEKKNEKLHTFYLVVQPPPRTYFLPLIHFQKTAWKQEFTIDILN